jgi:predicted RNA-binding protein with PIN domain
MHYLIDGYNLLFRLLRTEDSLQKQRNELIARTSDRVRLLGLDATLVFDSHYQPSEASKHHLGPLEIIYTNPGETADDYILKALKEVKDPTKHTVVTSDKILANLCRMRLAKTMAIDEFLQWIHRRQKNIAEEKKEARKQKEGEGIILRPLIRRPEPEPKKKVVEEGETKTLSLDDYERIFTESAQTAESALSEKKATRKALKGKKKSPEKISETDRIESDMARWLKAFEKEEPK